MKIHPMVVTKPNRSLSTSENQGTAEYGQIFSSAVEVENSGINERPVQNLQNRTANFVVNPK